MQATLTIRMDNAAFTESEGPELARILRELAAKVEQRFDLCGESFAAHDINGSIVGFLGFEGDE